MFSRLRWGTDGRNDDVTNPSDSLSRVLAVSLASLSAAQTLQQQGKGAKKQGSRGQDALLHW